MERLCMISRSRRPLLFFCMVFLLICLAVTTVGRKTILKGLFSSPLQDISEGSEVTLTGTLIRREGYEDYQTLYLKNLTVICEGRTIHASRFLIYDKTRKPFRIGNRLGVRGNLCFFEDATNPGCFSRKAYYERQNIYACMKEARITCIDNSFYRVRDGLAKLREVFSHALVDYAGEREGSVLKAILAGDKAGMDAGLKDLYKGAGIAHVLAISGLHLSFLGAAFYRLIRRSSGSYLIGGIFGIVFLSLYILMIGPGISSIRALVMFIIRLSADMTGRDYDAPTSLGVAAVIIICWRPLSMTDAAFQLSFGAASGVVLVFPLVNKKSREKKTASEAGAKLTEMVTWHLKQRWKTKKVKQKDAFDWKEARRLFLLFLQMTLREGLTAGLCITMTTLPIVIFHYFTFPLYGTVLNLLVIPLMSILLGLGFAGGVLSIFIPEVGGFLLGISGLILRFFEVLCRITESLPFSRIVTGRPKIVGILLFYLLFGWFLLGIWEEKIRKEKKEKTYKTAIRFVAIPVCAIVLLLTFTPMVYSTGFTITFLDVGQGDGIFLREGRTFACLVDGGSSSVYQVGKNRIEPFLLSQGVGKLKYVFVTHGDSDHIGGVEELISDQKNGVRIRCLVFPEQEVWDEKLASLQKEAQDQGIKTVVMHPGDEIHHGKLTVTCLAPDGKRMIETGNAASLVLDVSYGEQKASGNEQDEVSILLTGDVEGKGEQLLTKSITQTYDVLKAAHHGSGNSTKEAFLEKVKPKICIISAGADNPYGHPNAETLERLMTVGCKIFSTVDCGAVTINIRGNHPLDPTYKTVK